MLRFALAAAASASAFAATPSAQAPSKNGVDAGRYLAQAAHCAACHTSQADRPFAGNVAIRSPFGTMYSSNITPDPSTGIGRWSEADFVRALRLGRGRHGEYLYPSMPYTDFTRISDADAHALWLYFRTVAPVTEKQKANDMKFPFNVRPGIAAWQAVYFRPGRYVDDPSRSAQWNRGAYLVEGLGHCGACHTPKNIAMASKAGHALQGGETGDWWFAPDISGSRLSGIRDWDETEIVDYLRNGHNDLNVAAVGPMLETVAKGTSKLSDADLHAIATYLKHQKPAAPAKAPEAVAMTAAQKAHGTALYDEHCQSCHGADGKGMPGIAPALAGNTAVTASGSQTALHAIMQGFAASGPWGAMPSFAAGLDNRALADLANHVRTAWGNSAPADANERTVAHMRLDIDRADPRIEAALACPTVAASASDPATVASLDALAGQPQGAGGVPEGLFDAYRHRHPRIAPADAITDLSGLYCRALVKAPATDNPMSRQMRFIHFTAAISAQSTRRR